MHSDFSVFLCILGFCVTFISKANNVQSYSIPETSSYSMSQTSIDPFGILQSKKYKPKNIVKENCALLCRDCNGIAYLDDDVCRCHIKSDYPMQCVEKIQRKARLLGLNLRPKNTLRQKRCSGGELSEVGFPFSFGTLLGRSADNQVSNMDEQMVGGPSEMFNTFSGIITAPLIEQLRAVFSGDSETAENTIPGQIVANLPKAVSSFTNLLDTFNVAIPSSRQNMVGVGRSSDGSDDSDDDDDDGNGISRSALRTLQSLNRMRAMFMGDGDGNVQNTLPVQLASNLPKALNTAVDLFDSFSVGARRNSGSSMVGKSWLREFDDDDDDDNSNINKKSGSQSSEQKIIVSPFRSNGQLNTGASSSLNRGNVDQAFSNIQTALGSVGQQLNSGVSSLLSRANIDNIFPNLEAVLGSGEQQILQPQEAVIILSPVKLSQVQSSSS